MKKSSGGGNVKLIVNFTGKVSSEEVQTKAVYSVSFEDYENLAKKVEKNKDYNDALSKIFKNMAFVEQTTSFKIDLAKFDYEDYKNLDKFNSINYKTAGKTDEEIENEISADINETMKNDRAKVHKLFSAVGTHDKVKQQVAFLPYQIDFVGKITDTSRNTFTYTYKIYGISFCNIDGKSSNKIPVSEYLLCDADYEAKNIKAYYRDVEVSFTEKRDDFVGNEAQLASFIDSYLKGEKTSSDISVKSAYFGEIPNFGVLSDYNAKIAKY